MGTFESPRRGRGRFGRETITGGPIRPTFGDDGRHQKPDYKTLALCKQVRRTLALTLSGEVADPILQELMVDEVLPAPHASRLLVRVMLRGRENGPTVVEVLERLAKVEGLLRARVGEAIVRKRTPELAFLVVPAHAGAAPTEASDNGEVPHV